MCRATPVRRCFSTACCSRALRFSRSPSPRTRWRTRRARCSITPSRRSMTTTAARLSKSRFVTGCQCHKLLWWTVHEPDAIELQPDKVLQDLFDQGRQVGEAARARYPGGALIDLPHHARAERVAATQEAPHAGAAPPCAARSLARAT